MLNRDGAREPFAGYWIRGSLGEDFLGGAGDGGWCCYAEDGEVEQVSDDSQLAGRRAGSVIEAMAGTG